MNNDKYEVKPKDLPEDWINIVPDKFIEEVYGAKKFLHSIVAAHMSVLLREYMPKGTFTVWEESKKAYITYVRDYQGKDVPSTPIIGVGPSSTESFFDAFKQLQERLKEKPKPLSGSAEWIKVGAVLKFGDDLWRVTQLPTNDDGAIWVIYNSQTCMYRNLSKSELQWYLDNGAFVGQPA